MGSFCCNDPINSKIVGARIFPPRIPSLGGSVIPRAEIDGPVAEIASSARKHRITSRDRAEWQNFYCSSLISFALFVRGVQADLIGCRTGNGEKLSSSLAGPGQAVKSAVAVACMVFLHFLCDILSGRSVTRVAGGL